jgi:DNA-binding LacI/PurR family transcriptional regulator
MATLSEVAQIAGVTTATVSNVLRNPGKVKPSTIKRVKAAIAQVGYRPNLMARALSEGKSSMVAIVLPNIINPYYPEFVRIAERVARQRKYFLMVCNTDESADIGCAYIKQIAGTLADGVLVLHTGLSTSEILELRGGRRSPIVLASEETIVFADTIPHVVVNFRMAGLIAGRHLLELGHRRIGVIVGQGCDGPQILRLEGFKDALAEAGLVFDQRDVCYELDSVAGGHQAALSLVKADRGLTAIFATNDLLAFGAIQALADEGIKVPDDVSIVGVTDIQLAQEMRPALTTVALNIEEVAKSSINLLLDMIENPEHQPTLVRISDPQLIVRATTGPVRKD